MIIKDIVSFFFLAQKKTTYSYQNNIISKEEPLNQIFHLLQDNIHDYMQSSDHYIKMREGTIRKSRSIKASSCPINQKITK